MKKTTFYLAFLILMAGSILVACATSTSLTGVTWHLVSFGSASSPTAAVPDVETSLVFDGKSQFSGNMGCNSFSGEYKINGDKITSGKIISTMMACDEPRMQQETAVFKMLDGTNTYEVSGDKLTISNADGSSTLVFRK